jgi:ketosteroid isomerase-like protein
MNINEQLLHTFYQAFQHKDYTAMQNCYADEATFSDEVFKNLDAHQAKKMWEMLIKNGEDLAISYRNIQADDTQGSAEWVATYTFSKAKKKVVNHIKAEFRFRDGEIVQHVDRFSFYRWARQALGLTGWLLGWSKALKRQVQQTAMKSLDAYIRRNT